MDLWPLKGQIRSASLWKMGLSHSSVVNLKIYYSLYLKIAKLLFLLSVSGGKRG